MTLGKVEDVEEDSVSPKSLPGRRVPAQSLLHLEPPSSLLLTKGASLGGGPFLHSASAGWLAAFSLAPGGDIAPTPQQWVVGKPRS